MGILFLLFISALISFPTNSAASEKKLIFFKALPSISNKTLADVIQTNKNGLIYLWSPHMPLSVQGLKEIRQAAKSMNLPLLVLCESTANFELLAHWIENKTISSSEIITLNYDRLDPIFQEKLTYVHFPTLFIYKKAKLLDNGIPGYENFPRYRSLIESVLKVANK